MAKNVLEIVIKAKDQASAQVKTMGEKIKGSVKKLITLPHLIMAAGVTKAISTVIKAYGKQEEAIAKLNAVLRTLGIENEEVTKQITDHAAALQKVTKFGDEQIIAAQAMLLQLGVMPEQLEGATEATLDWATAMGKDVVAAATDLGKAAAGNLMMLQRYGVQLDATTFEAEGFDYVLGELEKRFGGQAEAVAKKGTGPLIQFRNLIGDVSEKIGEALIPGIIDIIEAIKPILPLVQKVTVGVASAISLAVNSLVTGTKILVAIWNRDWKKLVEISRDSSAKMTETAKKAFEEIAESSEKMTKGEVDGWGYSAGVHKKKTDTIVKNEEKALEESKKYADALREYKIKIGEITLQDRIAEAEAELELLKETGEAKTEHFIELQSMLWDLEQEQRELRAQAEIEQFDASKLRAEELATINQEVASGIATNFVGAFKMMASGEKDMANIHKHLMTGILNTTSSVIEKIMAKKIEESLLTKATSTSEAGAKSVSAYAGIPFVGLVLGLAAAAAASAAIAKFAEGGIVTKPTLGIVGEAGPEAVIPLNKLGRTGGINISNINIQLPGVTTLEDFRQASPSQIKDIVETKIFDAFKLLAREGKMETVVQV